VLCPLRRITRDFIGLDDPLAGLSTCSIRGNRSSTHCVIKLRTADDLFTEGTRQGVELDVGPLLCIWADLVLFLSVKLWWWKAVNARRQLLAKERLRPNRLRGDSAKCLREPKGFRPSLYPSHYPAMAVTPHVGGEKYCQQQPAAALDCIVLSPGRR
jgi:hypothetical protein